MSIYSRVQNILEGSLGLRRAARLHKSPRGSKKFIKKQEWRVGLTPDNKKFPDAAGKKEKLKKRLEDQRRKRLPREYDAKPRDDEEDGPVINVPNKSKALQVYKK
jgi:hypothetical protein